MDVFEWLSERGITVTDKERMLEAFTHSSYANEHTNVRDNERLEFMGDAVLQLWSSSHIFALEPKLSEGHMTRLRAQVVCEKALAEYASRLKLNEFLRLGSGEEKSGGREKAAIVADMMEAFLGALYLDQGMDAVSNILDEVLLPELTKPVEVTTNKDYKTKLQEYVQADSRRSVRYVLVSESGPSNAPTFVMNAVVDGLVMGTGSGKSKKIAEQNAAHNAFEKMVR